MIIARTVKAGRAKDLKKKGKKFRDENKPKVKMEIMKNTYHKL